MQRVIIEEICAFELEEYRGFMQEGECKCAANRQNMSIISSANKCTQRRAADCYSAGILCTTGVSGCESVCLRNWTKHVCIKTSSIKFLLKMRITHEPPSNLK